MNYWKSQDLINHLNFTNFENSDFEIFLDKHKPTEKDFIFIDPPYDTEFSTYDKKEFGHKDQERLANYLINKTNAQFLAIMKNTDFVRSLYEKHVKLMTFDKNYQVNIKNRNDNSAIHLIAYRTY